MLVALITTGLAFSGVHTAMTAFAADVVIVCNKNVPEDSLSKGEVKNIFLGKKTRWRNDEKIIFVISEASEAHKTFLKEYIGKNAFQYANYWKKQVFTGKGKPPKSFGTEESLLDYVSDTEGAIGYLPSEAPGNTVKTIPIN